MDYQQRVQIHFMRVMWMTKGCEATYYRSLLRTDDSGLSNFSREDIPHEFLELKKLPNDDQCLFAYTAAVERSHYKQRLEELGREE